MIQIETIPLKKKARMSEMLIVLIIFDGLTGKCYDANNSWRFGWCCSQSSESSVQMKGLLLFKFKNRLCHNIIFCVNLILMIRELMQENFLLKPLWLSKRFQSVSDTHIVALCMLMQVVGIWLPSYNSKYRSLSCPFMSITRKYLSFCWISRFIKEPKPVAF